jgi:protein SCO1
MSRKVIPWIAIASLLVIGLVLAIFMFNQRPAQEFNGSLIEPPMPAPDFTLTNQLSETVSLSDNLGKYVLLFFGYTNCPDECPATMGVLMQVYDQLKATGQADDVQVIFVTTDPAHDTPQALGEFLGRFDPDFIGLTGGKEKLENVWKDYGVTVADGGMTPSERVYLIDPQGNIRLTYPSAGNADDIVSDLKLLFAEK